MVNPRMVKWALAFLVLGFAAALIGGFAHAYFGIAAYTFFMALEMFILFAVLSKKGRREAFG
jgi:uncharacterized membrane protein YtjA (UPF0391 family)